jgi:hypothetical protein
MWETERQRKLPYYFVKHRPDTECLQHQFGYKQGPALWESMLNNDGENVVDGKAMEATLLLCKALARCWAPSTPILL